MFSLLSTNLCECEPSCWKHGGCCLDMAEPFWNQGMQADDRYKCTSLGVNKILITVSEKNLSTFQDILKII